MRDFTTPCNDFFSIKDLKSLKNSSSTGFPKLDLLTIEMMSSTVDSHFEYLSVEATLFEKRQLEILTKLSNPENKNFWERSIKTDNS